MGDSRWCTGPTRGRRKPLRARPAGWSTTWKSPPDRLAGQCSRQYRPVTMAQTPDTALPTAEDVDAAARRLDGVALHTPLVTSPVLDALTGARVFLKAETLQRTGSFKFRGAYNKLSNIPQSERGGGVVAFSSG